ncbi:MAG: hypothetical protein KBG30_04865 [Bacteroidales bacterium]|nr:hypothetical protein [Bacteroidales bacterium]
MKIIFKILSIGVGFGLLISTGIFLVGLGFYFIAALFSFNLSDFYLEVLTMISFGFGIVTFLVWIFYILFCAKKFFTEFFRKFLKEDITAYENPTKSKEIG